MNEKDIKDGWTTEVACFFWALGISWIICVAAALKVLYDWVK